MTKEEAINIVRNIYHTDTELEALKVLIPELKESEDERIRKVLITLLKVPRKEIFEAEGITKEQALAYLEKQKEPTTEELYTEAGTTEKEYIANTMKFIRAMRERKKEQKPEVKLKGWVARDKNGEIYVYEDYPEKDSERPMWIGSGGIVLDQESFSNIKWETGPVEVEITIRKK